MNIHLAPNSLFSKFTISTTLLRSLALVSLFLLHSVSAIAFFTLSESGEVTPEGLYKIGIEPQFVTSGDTGVNLRAFFDAPINDSQSFRFHIGTGQTDFMAGGSYKWIPIPDFENQPAIGGRFGASIIRVSDVTAITLHASPLISKKYSVQYGELIPFAGLPLIITSAKDQTTTGFNLVFGSEFIHQDATHLRFGGELGINLKESFSYLSVFATLYFDEERGLLLE